MPAGVRAEGDEIRVFGPSLPIWYGASPGNSFRLEVLRETVILVGLLYLFETMGVIVIWNENPIVERDIESGRYEVGSRIETASSFNTFATTVFPFFFKEIQEKKCKLVLEIF